MNDTERELFRIRNELHERAHRIEVKLNIWLAILLLTVPVLLVLREMLP